MKALYVNQLKLIILKKMKLFKRGYKNLLKDPSIIYDKKNSKY